MSAVDETARHNTQQLRERNAYLLDEIRSAQVALTKLQLSVAKTERETALLWQHIFHVWLLGAIGLGLGALAMFFAVSR